MYSDIDEEVILERNCEATLIPFGNKITLKKGEEGHITQALGGSYTIMIRGNLVRIEGSDADAIGKVIEVQPWLEENNVDIIAASAELRKDYENMYRRIRGLVYPKRREVFSDAGTNTGESNREMDDYDREASREQRDG